MKAIKEYPRQSITTFLILALLCTVGCATLVTNYRPLWRTFRENFQPQEPGDMLRLFFSSIDVSLRENVAWHREWIDLFGLAMLLQDRQGVPDPNGWSLLKDSAGYLHFVVLPMDVEPSVQSYARFVETLRRLGIPDLYILVPNKRSLIAAEVRPPLDNLANSSADAFLESLDQIGLTYLDLRAALKESELKQEQLFYRTDHHWATPAAVWSAQYIAKDLQTRNRWETEMGAIPTATVGDLSGYDERLYAGRFLGSQGKRVGRLYAGMDDFVLLTPQEAGDYAVYIDFYQEPAWQGDFAEAFIREEALDPQNPLETSLYGAFLTYDMPLIRLVNRGNPEGKRLVIIKDSFAQSMAPYLTQYFAEVDLIDLRFFYSLDTSLEECLGILAPDCVAVFYNCENFAEIMFDFDREGFGASR